MKIVQPELLLKISNDILSVLRTTRCFDLVQQQVIDYHGFQKSRLPEALLQGVLQPLALTEQDVQIEIVGVTTDLTGEVHRHNYAHAYTYILGDTEGAPNPKGASAYFYGKICPWQPVQEGQWVDIPPGRPHGFSVEAGGVLWFLSVQSPPIVGHEGHDDYYKEHELCS